jgi:hypothetical protein
MPLSGQNTKRKLHAVQPLNSSRGDVLPQKHKDHKGGRIGFLTAKYPKYAKGEGKIDRKESRERIEFSLSSLCELRSLRLIRCRSSFA